ncbi:hypothetical protein OCK74_03775 [Chitinophagaceae bacterium LB-8]|uniref:Uncharacterized protein n=1 Tax=Paraflavisolibacter caeni TaxID=2982496 RepID=A0A9X2XTC3_9BACT|nr:hypothetical protein [Paraflavisolibacter caeni]MCU7548215.1 hypothetical protein [Paraflavisolibacter caeni]
MNLRNMVAVQPVKGTGTPKTTAKRAPKQYVNTLEYELITNLVQQQYSKDGEVNFPLLLSIPLQDRIPALVQEFGVKRMYHLLLMIVKAFTFSLPIPKTKKLNDTRMSVCACDLILTAQEDQLSLEDIILFFERAKAGKYGSIKSLISHYQVMTLLDKYRAERHEAFMKIKDEKDAALKTLGPTEKTCEEPKQIGEILKQASIFDMNKRMSG